MSKFSDEQRREIQEMVDAALRGDTSLERFMPGLDSRLRSSRHESGDHVDRALAVRKLTPGTSGQVLRSVAPTSRAGGVYADWSDAVSPYYAKMYAANSGSPTHTLNGSAQKVGSGGGTLTWTSDFDIRPSGVAAQVDTSTNKRLDVRKTGVYLVQGAVYFTSLADGKTASVNIYVNGTGNLIFENKIIGATSDAYVSASRLYKLNSGDYLELYAYQNDSASEAYFPGTKLIYLSMLYVGPSS